MDTCSGDNRRLWYSITIMKAEKRSLECAKKKQTTKTNKLAASQKVAFGFINLNKSIIILQLGSTMGVLCWL